MKIRINEDLTEYKPQIGDIVGVKYNYPYKQPIMKRLVKTNHVFVITEIYDTMIKVHAMTSKIDRINLYPTFYTKVQSGNREALVQLNAWGLVSKDVVRKVIDRLSAEDIEKVKKDIKTKHPSQTTICEDFDY